MQRQQMTRVGPMANQRQQQSELPYLGAGIGALVGLAFGSRQRKVLIYEDC